MGERLREGREKERNGSVDFGCFKIEAFGMCICLVASVRGQGDEQDTWSRLRSTLIVEQSGGGAGDRLGRNLARRISNILVHFLTCAGTNVV